MKWTESEYDEYMQKFNKDIKPYHPDTMESDEGPESKLQNKIVKWADDHGYPVISFKQSKNARSFIRSGLCDITLALPDKRTVWIELKSQKGYLKESQKQFAIKLLYLGHEWYCVKSFKRFLEIMEGK